MTISEHSIPVIKEVLVWAREYRGLSVPQAAEQLGITSAELQLLEDGQRAVTASLLSRMVSAYRTSESLLLLPTPPAPTTLPTDYRTVGGAPATPSPDTITAIRQAQEFQSFLSELLRDEPELLPHFQLPTVERQSVTGEDAAKTERERIGVTIEQQLQWLPIGTFNQWRFAIERQGIVVLVKKMPVADCRGFSLSDNNKVPVLVVNGTDFERAQIFTLMHEYAHLLTRHPGVCVTADSNTSAGQTERWFNEFAAAFLIPQAHLVEQVHRSYRYAGPDYEWPLAQIRSLASKYRVSRAAMALRLQTLKLAPPDYYDRHRVTLNYSEARPERDLNKPLKIKHPPGWKERQKIRELGVSGASAVIEAWRAQVTDTVDVAYALDLSLDEILGLEERLEVERHRRTA